MTPPNLDCVWETFVRIGPLEGLSSGRHLETLRRRVAPLIAELQARELISWYSLLIHDESSGVPTRGDDRDTFWHIRLDVLPQANHEALLEALPSHCEMTRYVARGDLQLIAGLTASKLQYDISDAWRIIGDQSEWLLRKLAAYKHDLSWEDMWPEIGQYLHFYANMTCLQVR